MSVPWGQETGAAAPLQAEQEQDGPGYRHRSQLTARIALSDFLGEVNPRTPYFLNEARARRYTFARTHIDVDHLNGE